MTTEQKYVGGGCYATPFPQKAELLDLGKQLAGEWVKWFWREDRLTDEELKKAQAIAIPDDSMSPQLSVGGGVVIVRQSPKEFYSSIGKVVAILTKDSPLNYTLGRLRKYTKTHVILSRDNPDFPEVVIDRAKVGRVYSVKLGFCIPVR